MVNRFTLSPDRLILRNSLDSTVFDTNKLYLRYGSSLSSTLSISGYYNIPLTFGDQYYAASGTQYDQGGFRSAPVSAVTISNSSSADSNPSLSVDLNAVGGKSTTYKWVLWNPSNAKQGPRPLNRSSTYVYKDPLVKQYYVDGVLSGDFQWYCEFVNTGVSTYNSSTWVYTYELEPLIYPVITYNQNYPTWKTGTYNFPASTNAVYNWSKTSGATVGQLLGTTASTGSNSSNSYLSTVRLPAMVAMMEAPTIPITMRVTL